MSYIHRTLQDTRQSDIRIECLKLWKVLLIIGTVFVLYINVMGIMVQWYNGTIVQWYSGTMVQWYNGTMVQWYNGIIHRYPIHLVKHQQKKLLKKRLRGYGR